MVERQTPERDVPVIPRKRWLCPDMAEKLLTGKLNFNSHNKNNKKTTTTLIEANYKNLNFKA